MKSEMRGIDKGPRYNDGYPKWLCFLLALGDDSTDEEIFAVLPRQAYSIHVESLRVTLNLHDSGRSNSWQLLVVDDETKMKKNTKSKTNSHTQQTIV